MKPKKKLPDWTPAKAYKVGQEIDIVDEHGTPKRVRITAVSLSARDVRRE